MLNQYFKINLETGVILDSFVYDSETDDIPDDCKLGWGDQILHEPVYDLETDSWIEGKSSDDILDTYKITHILHLKSRCESEIEKGFTATNGHFYRTNRDDQTNMLGQFNAISTDQLIETVMWKTEDAGYISHTREGWLDIYRQAFTHKQTQLFKYDTLKKQVNDAKTHEELTAITWDEPETTTTTTQG